VYGLIVYLDRRDTQQSSESTEEEFLDISYVNEETNLLVDSDGDGVYDWEEGLWDELDPNNPDSDGDGISDAEYIAQKKREYTQDLYERAGIEPLSETERFGRSIYTAIYAATQNGEDLDPEDREQISDNIQKYIGTIPLSGKQYLREDLNLTSNSESSVRAYEQAVRDFFDRYEVTLEDAELIFTSIEDPSSFRAQIGERTRYYEEMLGNLLEFEVPLVIAHRHVDLVNAIAQMYGAFNNLNSQEFDEVIAISSVSQLEQITQNLLEAQMYIYRFFDIANEPDTFAS
jgi:hypothetical protein